MAPDLMVKWGRRGRTLMLKKKQALLEYNGDLDFKLAHKLDAALENAKQRGGN